MPEKSDKFGDTDASHWVFEPPPDPETLTLAMLSVADETDSDEEAQAAIAQIAGEEGDEDAAP